MFCSQTNLGAQVKDAKHKWLSDQASRKQEPLTEIQQKRAQEKEMCFLSTVEELQKHLDECVKVYKEHIVFGAYHQLKEFIYANVPIQKNLDFMLTNGRVFYIEDIQNVLSNQIGLPVKLQNFPVQEKKCLVDFKIEL